MKKITAVLLCVVLSVCLIPVSATYAKTVKAKSVTLNIKQMTISIGGVATLEAKKTPTKSNEKLIWKSSNPKVAKVSKAGVVTGVSEGNAMISVKTAKSKRTAKCRVKVEKYLTAKDVVAPSGGENWTDGTALELYSKQSFPMELVWGKTISSSLKVNGVRIVKSHFDQFNDEGYYYRFKYDLEIKGTFLSGSMNHIELGFEFFNKETSNVGQQLYIPLELNSSYWPYESKMTKDGDNFTLTVSNYYSDEDYDGYLIKGIDNLDEEDGE